MKPLYVCLIVCLVCLFVSQEALADYVLTLSNGSILRRITDSGETVWETTGIELNVQPEFAPGDDSVVYTAVAGWGDNRKVTQFDAATGTLIGDATEPQSGRINELQWGADYNGDGVGDVWTCSQDGTFLVYDGTTFGTVLPDIPLNTWDIADVNPNDGTGGRSLVFGPDLTGDGIGELYACKGYNNADGKINVWDPTNMTKVATYPIPECREVMGIILGPDVNGDGREDLWIASSRRNEIQAYDYTDGTSYGKVDLGVDDLRFPLDVDHGPNGTILIATRFATSLDPDATGGEVAGGDLIQYDPATGVATLIYEHTDRIDGVAYIAPPIPEETPDIPDDESIAKKAISGLTIDGNLSDWIDAGAVFKFIGEPKDVLRGDWGGPDDSSCVWSVMWDDTNIYFAAAVRDDIFTPVTAINANWKADCIFIYIDADADGVVDNTLSVFPLDGAPTVRYHSGIEEGSVTPAVVMDARLGDGGRFVEVAIPVASMTNMAPVVGNAFNLQVGIEEGITAPDSGKFLCWNGLEPGNDGNQFPVTFDAPPIPEETPDIPEDESIAYQAVSGLTIDGDLSDWINSGAVFKFIGEPNDVMRGDWTGPEDCSLLWSVMWDDTNFYFAAALWDDVYTPVTAVNANWKADCLFLFIDADADETSDNKPCFFLLDGVPTMRNHGGIDDVNNVIDIAIVRDSRMGDGGMFFEVAIPLAAMTNMMPEAGKVFRMSPGKEEGITAPDSGKFLTWGGVNVDEDPLPIVTFAIPEIPVDPGTEGLVASYSMENDVVDGSGNGRDGVLIGEPVFVEGMVGNALDFGQTGTAAVEIPAAGMSASSGTVAMWANLATVQSPPDDTRYLFGHSSIADGFSDRIQLYMDEYSTDLDFGLGDSHGLSPNMVTLDTETWYHVAFTWDGSSYVVYLDGQELMSGSYTGLTTLSTTAQIGNNGVPGWSEAQGRNQGILGVIDEVVIYSRALSGLEVQYLAGI